MFQGIERRYDLIICNLCIEKSDFDYVDETMFQSEENPCEKILSLLDSQKK
jgi:hypothetical protein